MTDNIRHYVHYSCIAILIGSFGFLRNQLIETILFDVGVKLTQAILIFANVIFLMRNARLLFLSFPVFKKWDDQMESDFKEEVARAARNYCDVDGTQCGLTPSR